MNTPSTPPITCSSWLASRKLYLLWFLLSLANALFQYLSTLSLSLGECSLSLVRQLAQFTGMHQVTSEGVLTQESVLYPSMLIACYMTLIFLREGRASARMHLCILMLMCLMLAPFVSLIWGMAMPITAPTMGLLFLYFLHIGLPNCSRN